MEQKLTIQKAKPRKTKIKYYVVNQNNYESDTESDASTEQNEIDNNGNDDDYDKTIKKKRNKQKFIKKVKQPTNNQRKRK